MLKRRTCSKASFLFHLSLFIALLKQSVSAQDGAWCNAQLCVCTLMTCEFASAKAKRFLSTWESTSCCFCPLPVDLSEVSINFASGKLCPSGPVRFNATV